MASLLDYWIQVGCVDQKDSQGIIGKYGRQILRKSRVHVMAGLSFPGLPSEKPVSQKHAQTWALCVWGGWSKQQKQKYACGMKELTPMRTVHRAKGSYRRERVRA